MNDEIIIFVVEGIRDDEYLSALIKTFFSGKHSPIILSLPLEKNIYRLWNQIKNDPAAKPVKKDREVC